MSNDRPVRPTHPPPLIIRGRLAPLSPAATAKTPGIRLYIAHDRVVRLTDRSSGRWLANLRWRSHGQVYIELAEHVRKAVIEEQASGDK